MNIADSLKHVLKSKSQNILSDFWSRDLKVILTSFTEDISHMYKSGASSLHQLKNGGVRFSPKEIQEAVADSWLILKVFPGRVKEALVFFKDDLLEELEKQADPKQKALFSFKVLGALTSFTLGIIYNVKRGQTEFNLKGLKRRNAFTRFIVAELIFKITQHFLQRILSEVEQELTDPEDKKSIRYFRQLLTERKDLEESLDDEIDADKAIEIIEDFKTHVMTGKRRKLSTNS
ncbi:MAG: hypothetical protein ACLGHN_09390 [Bacteriovoracia bacterium]